ENYRSGGGQFRPAKGGQFGPAEADFFYRRKVVNLDRRGLDTLSVLSSYIIKKAEIDSFNCPIQPLNQKYCRIGMLNFFRIVVKSAWGLREKDLNLRKQVKYNSFKGKSPEIQT
ncbi:MAG: hypothetical protein NTW49_05160, partial [Bacteroidia bacterium]|nr:hypothetical protein [Bacteroidia bacterium]